MPMFHRSSNPENSSSTASNLKAGFILRKTNELQLPYHEYSGTIEQSPNDPRKFRLIQLPNNMTVLCAHDPDTTQSAVSLSVNVGHNGNPPEFLGIAHFLEHMLFQGSEKYPGKNEYSSYLSAHSGYANAFTNNCETCYHFSLANDALKGALDRFSRFFIDPLMDASCVDKELLAVDSEHKGNIQSDTWRFFGLLANVSNPNHPFSQFSTGTVDTLKGSANILGVELREELLKFHNKYYSSDIMKLVVAGNHTLDQLTEWAVSMFSEVESKGNTKPVLSEHTLSKSELGKVVSFETVNDIYDIVLSRLDYDIDANSFGLYDDGSSMFYIGIDATPDGMDNYADIVHAIFAYMDMLTKQGLQKWYHDELHSVNAISYHFYERSNIGHWITGEFNSSLVADIINYLNPNNYMLMVGAKKHRDVECDIKEQYYGIKYNVVNMPATLKPEQSSFAEYEDVFSMPTSTEIPLGVVNEPTLLRSNDRMKVWFKQDDRFFVPKGKIMLSIRMPATNTPMRHALVDLYNMYASEILHTELEQAQMAGLHYHFAVDVGTIDISISGFSDKQSVLLQAILCKFNPQRADNITIQQLQLLADHMFGQTFFKLIVSGNFDEKDALDIAQMIDDTLDSRPLADYCQFGRARCISMPAPMPDKNSKESATICYVYCDQSGDTYETAVLDLLDKLMSEPFFDQLRTKEQLGYRVHANIKTYGKSSGLQFYIQGESNPTYATMRIDAFVHDFRQYLLDFDAAKLATQIKSIVDQARERVKNISQETARYWSQIDSEKYDFGSVERGAEQISRLTRDDLIAFWDKYINPQTAPHYTRVDNQVWSSATAQPSAEQFGAHTSGTIALHGCLHKEGLPELSLAKVESMVSNIAAANFSANDEDALLSRLGDMNTGKNALQMAIDSSRVSFNHAVASGKDFTKIGMHQSPDGVWLITDIEKFKATQMLHGSSIPYAVPVPKYNY
ncbi:Metalloenzyme, LuxS/M16 peptidase-like protein [Kickxella alabastrina]|uniref:Metalloenzyme, LuxS/M16 peptidase-like protein n=1 Tax=Kickxella alabastrina TaxID=61397 RepID=UPI002220AC06|nr:Metalloenzyme, LuxS/M16 peptidase-like protein [Kickxella alabastrina]KAI7834372.1 Metalloenzyme, LuxS/M16 peptidase-like protein [Kickxella alabastrina]